MITNTQQGNLGDVDYASFLDRLRKGFEERTRGKTLFHTSGGDLWTAYLSSFPAELRQHHNCNACRHFIERYGSLAVVGPDGQLISALWDENQADQIHQGAVRQMRRFVQHNHVVGIFMVDARNTFMGRPTTGQWRHLFLEAPMQSICPPGLLDAHQVMAAKKEEHDIVCRALGVYSLQHLNQAVTLLESDVLYRGEKVLGPVKWLRDLKVVMTTHRYASRANNLVWLAIAEAPSGFCHPTSSMAGSLLEDLASGMPLDGCARRFAAKMHPLQYQRPQAPPKEGAIKRAEEIFAQMDLGRSLDRRFARLEDVQALWLPVQEQETGGLFGHLSAMRRNMAPAGNLPPQVITWDKFQRTVLPQARKIEALVPYQGQFTALTTAVHADARPILQWDSDPRNPVNWYMYSGGSRADQWKLQSGTWVPVTGVCLSPHQWHGRQLSHHAKGAVVILEGCADTTFGQGNAIFPEDLLSDLREVRSVIEAYSKRATLAGRSEATACGLWVGQVTLAVTDPSGLRLQYKIDRWD